MHTRLAATTDPFVTASFYTILGTLDSTDNLLFR